MANKTNFQCFIILISLVSCAYNYRQTESIGQKSRRLQSRNIVVNKAPKLHIHNPALDKKWKKVQTQRRDLSSYNSRYSNKTLYFLTLYNQYQEFSTFTQKRFNPIKSCPSFHTPFSLYKKKNPMLNKKHYLNHKKPSQLSLSLYPELSLPLLSKNVYSYWKKHNKVYSLSKVVQKGINIHIQKLKSELEELCEYGNSDNYYIFANIMNLPKSYFKRNEKNLRILLKTTVFSNMVLLSSLNENQVNRKIASNKKEV